MAELIDLITSNFDYENFFSAKLTAPLTATDTDIFMDAIPSASEGVLVIDWDVAASREVIFYNSKTASKVVVPSTAERGFDDSTATTHLSGANVIMAPVRAWFRLAQQLATTSTAAWKALGYTPNTITNNGNRSVTMVFNSVDLTSFISTGYKLRGTRTVAAPNQCAALTAGSSHYFSRASGSLTGMTFTGSHTTMGWVKPTAVPSGGTQIIGRTDNATGGFSLGISTDLRVRVFYGGASSFTDFYTTRSLPLNRWTHVGASVNAAAKTCVTTFDGISTPNASVLTAATTVTQTSNLEIGRLGANYASIKVAQLAIFSTNISAATILTYMNQGLAGTESNLVSAYSFNNSINDLNTTNANNLTANNGVVATNSDSPFSLDDEDAPGSYEWGKVVSISFSTNTTMVVQTPEGSAWPTSGGISSMQYSTENSPLGFPTADMRWYVESIYYYRATGALTSLGTWYYYNNTIEIPIGKWRIKAYGHTQLTHGGATNLKAAIALSTSSSTISDNDLGTYTQSAQPSSNEIDSQTYIEAFRKITTSTPYYLIARPLNASSTIYYGEGNGLTAWVLRAELDVK